MNFIALDVETANADNSTICQIGLVGFENSRIVDKWTTLINPESYFDPFNVRVHKITESDAKGAPTFSEVYDELAIRINGKITAHHMPFDRIAINRACIKNNLDKVTPKWLDTARVVRMTWDDRAQKGYGLSKIAKLLDIKFNHHDALEDARTAGMVLVKAIEKSGLSLQDWSNKFNQPIYGDSRIVFDDNTDGSLQGENLVFTGTLYRPRKEVAKIATDLGCNVSNNVSNKTTILVVGLQLNSQLAGYDKSSKHRKAEDYKSRGIPIKIISENDFVEICNRGDSSTF